MPADDKRECTPSALEKEETALLDLLQSALDGICVHEWDLNASGARGGLIASHPNGARWAIQLQAWKVNR